ncbi:MAG: YraN family protein [Bacteroides sp.]|nr:YraN family protein [Bacteroides sp.]MCM1085238.1 YraN family protein [Bacteroides sp.]MCM1168714.1 YraN family protein [Bacteroides sp.]
MKTGNGLRFGEGFDTCRVVMKHGGKQDAAPFGANKRNDYRIGMAGEVLAAAYLKNKGYELLTSNYRFAHREIDLILKKDGELVFVEVKTRAPNSLVTAPGSVDMRKQMFLYSVASKYIHENRCRENVRFDIVWIERRGSACRVVEHIRNAFSPFGG